MPDALQAKNDASGSDTRALVRVPVMALLLMLSLAMLKPAAAAAPPEEVVSFKCALAIKAVFAELEKLLENPITKEAIGNIDDQNGQFVCIEINPGEIQVRLQSTDLTSADNRLVFALDAATYVVRKTYFGR
jgi:hypothetical protein